MLCSLKTDSSKLFAIKSIRKEDIIENEQVEHTRAERQILQSVKNSPCPKRCVLSAPPTFTASSNIKPRPRESSLVYRTKGI